ncbi:hypothetical protein Hdeb2414_s0006g00202011 [Helianthus debilis subsp. tardiflorus]
MFLIKTMVQIQNHKKNLRVFGEDDEDSGEDKKKTFPETVKKGKSDLRKKVMPVVIVRQRKFRFGD